MVSIVHSSWDLLGSFMLLHFLIWGSLSLQDLVDYDGLIRGWGEPFCSPPHRSADSSAPWQTKKTWNPGKPPCQVLYLSQLSQHLGPPKEGRCNSPKHLILCQRHPQWDSLQVSDASSKSINPPRAKQTSRFQREECARQSSPHTFEPATLVNSSSSQDVLWAEKLEQKSHQFRHSNEFGWKCLKMSSILFIDVFWMDLDGQISLSLQLWRWDGG